MTALRDDLDDIAVLKAAAERNHPAVDAGANALVADVRVDHVREIHGRGAARQRADLAFRREDVDVLGVQIDLQVLEEFLRIPNLLLHFEKLAHPLEIALVAVIADASFLVLPMRRDPFLRAAMHLLRADLHFEGNSVVADDRGVQ